MKKQFSILKLVTFALAFCAIASMTLAHEHDIYKIGDKYFLITVGSLNEPFVVDSMSGVDFRVSQIAGPHGNGTSASASKGTPVTGLDQTLKVELAAGTKKETLSLDPSDRSAGAYTAPFIPTVQTTYSYRIFGTINGNAVDLTFTCVPGEVSEKAEDNSQLKVSDTITRVSKIGAFGCPAARSVAGFPEPALSSYELSQNTRNVDTTVQAAGKQASMAQTFGIAGLIAGLLGLGVAVFALKRN